jgi:peptidoglycan hydrolase-like protein with peptidoglycan-binding domain
VRRPLGIAAVCSAVVIAAVVGVAAFWHPTAGAPAPERDPVATATITRQTLTDTVTVNGKLAYGPPVTAESRLAGTVTSMAAVGTTVQRGHELFRIDDTPVILFYGTVPAYRQLTTTARGRDVEQVEENLKALGYTGFTVDDAYTSQTASAVRRWQADLGLTETGVVELGRVFYAPGPIRIAEQKLASGQVAAGAVLSYTGTGRLVTAQIPVQQEDLAHVGSKVTIALPSGPEIGGTVQAVRTPDAQSAQEPMVELVVAIGKTDAGDGQVKVRLTVDKRNDVLAVPVGALLALAEGGYGIQILDGGSSRIVGVTTGLFADGLVEIDGPGVREGLTVGMAR